MKGNYLHGDIEIQDLLGQGYTHKTISKETICEGSYL